MRIRSALLAAVALLLTGCDQMTNEEAFGSSFDKCLVKNAIRSTNNGDRSLAQAICERHFRRAATPAEAQMGETNVTVDWPLQPNISMVSNGITATFRNTNQDVIVKRVSVSVEFHNSAKGKDGKWPSNDPGTTLTWDFPASLEPDELGTFSGSFADGTLPGLFFEGHATAAQVVPYN